MPRVIAGTAKGRRLAGLPDDHVRPTTDRVKEAWASMVLPWLADGLVLDLYAGSGALAVEALSRGASHAVVVEQDRGALGVISDNLATTGLADRATVLPMAVELALSGGSALRAGRAAAGPDARFALVVLDPPYDLDDDTLARVLADVADVVDGTGVVTVERDQRSPAPVWPARLRPREPRRYGRTVLHVADAATLGGHAAGPVEPESHA